MILCANNGHSFRYNTAVVLDTDGAFLGKYHKQNLWGETNIDVPQDCPELSFTTSFGVKFGVVICADLIYNQPILKMLAEGVRGWCTNTELCLTFF